MVVSLNKHALDYEQAISYADGEDLIWSCPAVSHGDSFYSYNGQDYYAWTYGNFSIKALTSNEQTPAPDVPVNPVDPRDALAAEHRGDVPDGTYFIQSAVNQGYVLDVRWASGDNRANVQLYEKNDSNAQRWRISHDENGYLTLTNAGSGKVLDVNSAGTANETNIQLYETNGSKAQRWVLSQNSTLDDLAYAHRNELKDGVYTIQSAVHRGYVLDVSGGSHSNYANVQLYQSNGTGAQKWRVSHDAKGYMTLTCVGSGKVLDVSGANTANETNIQQYESNGTKAQKWIAVRQPDGSMDLVSALDRKKRVDLRWGTIANGTNIQLYDSNGTKAQRWVFAN